MLNPCHLRNHNYFDVHDTLYKEAAHSSESETDDEMERVKSLVDTFLVRSETEEKSETEDTSPDSEWESGKLMETDTYESESHIYVKESVQTGV